MSPRPTSEISPFAFIALSIAAFGSGVSQRVSDPLLPRFASDSGVSLGAASWVVTIFTLAYGSINSSLAHLAIASVNIA